MAKLSNQVSDTVSKRRATRAPQDSTEIFSMLDRAEQLRQIMLGLLKEDSDWSFRVASELGTLIQNMQAVGLLLSHSLPIAATEQAVDYGRRLMDLVLALTSAKIEPREPAFIPDDPEPSTFRRLPRDAEYRRRLAEVRALFDAGPLTDEDQEVVQSFIEDYDLDGVLDIMEDQPASEAGNGDNEDDEDEDLDEDFDELIEEGEFDEVEEESDFEHAGNAWDEGSFLPGNLRLLVNLNAVHLNVVLHQIDDTCLGLLTESGDFDANMVYKELSMDELAHILCAQINGTLDFVATPLLALFLNRPDKEDSGLERLKALVRLAIEDEDIVSTVATAPAETALGELEMYREELAEAGILTGEDEADLEFLQRSLREEPFLRLLFDDELKIEFQEQIGSLLKLRYAMSTGGPDPEG